LVLGTLLVLSDYRDDSHEWNNVAADPAHAKTKQRLAAYLPEVNAPWSPKSIYEYNDYLTKHRQRNL
jgi:hypothetical protein